MGQPDSFQIIASSPHSGCIGCMTSLGRCSVEILLIDPGGQRCYRASIPRPILQDFCCLYALFPWYNISAFYFPIIGRDFGVAYSSLCVDITTRAETRCASTAGDIGTEDRLLMMLKRWLRWLLFNKTIEILLQDRNQPRLLCITSTSMPFETSLLPVHTRFLRRLGSKLL